MHPGVVALIPWAAGLEGNGVDRVMIYTLLVKERLDDQGHGRMPRRGRNKVHAVFVLAQHTRVPIPYSVFEQADDVPSAAGLLQGGAVLSRLGLSSDRFQVLVREMLGLDQVVEDALHSAVVCL
ncbi:hypothetical protein KJ567_06800 [Candidatus Bipolaricaulota bacterium]|nr:hypothetical protein [Candidatus Bipolaricaulota bacterium]